jgi:PAS domain S-box-containing protein
VRPAALALLAVILIGAPAVAVAGDTQPIPTVLVISHANTGYIPLDALNARMDRVLRERSNQPVDVQTEFLDLMISRGDDYERAVIEYIRQKYTRARILALVGVGAQGAAMAARLRGEVFPNAAVLYMAVERRAVATIDFGGNATGVVATLDVAGTIALARKLLPATEHIAVVLGGSDNERPWYGRMLSEIQAAAPGVDVIPLFGLEKNEMLRRISTLPERTVIVWVAYRRDPFGAILMPNEVLTEARRVASAPMFGVFEYDFGGGIVGGRLADLERQGEEAGVLAARIVNGERADSIPPVVFTDNPVKIDWREMLRWRIDPRLLPPDAVVYFREPTVWDSYKGYIVGGGAMLVAEAAIIAALLLERRRRRRATAALRESERRSTAMLQAAPDTMFLLSADGVYLDHYAKSVDELLVPPEQFLGRSIWDVLPRELAERFASAFRKALAGRAPETVEYELDAGGHKRYYEARIVASGAGTLLAVVRDVTERRTSEEELRRLTERLLRLQDEERKRVAAELHDGLGQNLSIIRNRVAICLRDVSDTDRVAEQLREISDTAAASIDEVREIAHNLRPFELDRLGLTEAVRSMAGRVSDSAGIRVVADVDLAGANLSSEDETSVYRIVQEALTNVVRHAAATEARVSIARVDSHLVVSVSDDGRGVNQAAGSLGEATPDGFGLADISQRARMLGGSARVDSAAGRGTTVTVTVPAHPRHDR